MLQEDIESGFICAEMREGISYIQSKFSASLNATVFKIETVFFPSYELLLSAHLKNLCPQTCRIYDANDIQTKKFYSLRWKQRRII